MKPLFADSFFFLAILNPEDQHHKRASDFARGNVRPLVTTTWVLTEVGDALAGLGNRETFVEFMGHIVPDRNFRIVPASQALFANAFGLYARRLDKEWSLTDCVSFFVMQQEDILEAVTGDHHFEQAGFTALLK